MEEQVKLFVSMPKADYDNLMKFKEGLVCKVSMSRYMSDDIWSSNNYLIFDEASSVNRDMMYELEKTVGAFKELEKLKPEHEKLIKENKRLLGKIKEWEDLNKKRLAKRTFWQKIFA